MNPLAPLSILPGALGVLDAPRRELFQLAGAEDGSGSALLESLFGVDPTSTLGEYGGLAAEVVADPLNLLGAGAVKGVTRGLGALSDLHAAQKATDLQFAQGVADAAKKRMLAQGWNDVEAVRRVSEVPGQADETFGLLGGEAQMPPGSAGRLFPEMLWDSKTGRRPGGPVLDAAPGAEFRPHVLEGQDAGRWLDVSRKQLRRDMGDSYDATMLPDYRKGVLDANRAANESIRADAWAAYGSPRVTTGEVLGPDAGMLDRVRGLPELAGRNLDDPAQIGDLSGVMGRLEAELLARSRVPADPTPFLPARRDLAPLLEQLMQAGGYSGLAAGAGTQFLGQ